MARGKDTLLTSLAPVIWGSTYLVTTELLPQDYPITVSMLRALPAGLILLLIVRQFPSRDWLAKIMILGTLNFSLFWICLFIAAYRLPGGVAAMVGSLQPLIVVLLANLILGSAIRPRALAGAMGGVAGVALLLLTPQAELDGMGIAAGLLGAASMALGTVLTRKWQPPVSTLTFTAWQLVAGGLLLVPIALVLEPPLPIPTGKHLLGFTYLGVVGAALSYLLWFRGIARIEPAVVSTLGFLSPLTAVLLGWVVLEQKLTFVQTLGAVAVFVSIQIGQSTATASRGTRRMSKISADGP